MKVTDDVVMVLKELCKTEKGITVVLDSNERKFISYNELWNRSYYLSQWLKDHGIIENSEVIIKCQNIEKYLYAFWAGLIGEFIAMPVDASQNSSAESLLAYVLEKADHPVIISDIEINDSYDAEIININDLYDDILSCNDYTKAEYHPSPDNILYVLYSSGTTGIPHGVSIKKSNVSANAYGVIRQYDIDENDKFVSWLSLTHCYGLVTFHLTPLLARAEHCLFSSKLYMSQPLLWMDLIHEYKATRFSSVPFALKHFTTIYENSEKNFRWDLSGTKSMFIGAEQVNFALFKEFCDITKPYGFTPDKVYPQYGLTEATVIVTGNKAGEQVNRFKVTNDKLIVGDKVEGHYIVDSDETDNVFLEMGTALETIRISIRDNDFCELGELYLGQICVSGPCVSSGYYKDDETTEKIFVDHTWLCTGDTGFIYQDNLYIIGREKELVVANGKKISCSSIESMIEENICNSKFEQCVVCNGIKQSNENEKVIVFVKTSFNKNEQSDILEFLEFENRVITLAFKKIGLTISEVIPIEVIPKTSSGKVFRRGLTEKYNAGEYRDLMNGINREPVSERAAFPESNNEKYAKERVSDAIISIIAQKFNIKIENHQVPFSECGIVSLNIPSFMTALSEKFLIQLDIADVFKHFNVTKLTDRIYYLLNYQDSGDNIGSTDNQLAEPELSDGDPNDTNDILSEIAALLK